MEKDILTNLQNPSRLEKLYRTDKITFKRSFDILYPEIQGQILADFWHERLHYAIPRIFPTRDVLFIIISAFVSGFVLKLPSILSIPEEPFLMRNAGLAMIVPLITYFTWMGKISYRRMLFLFVLILGCVIFINTFPGNPSNDIFLLVCLHFPILLWAIWGMAYMRFSIQNLDQRLSFLKFNGDLIILTALIGMAGIILSALTIGLFDVIGMDIGEFYAENIAIVLLPAAPLLGAYLIQNNPGLVGKISPMIASICNPLVLTMLMVYLVTIIFTNHDIYHNREFLLIFNLLLVGVLVLIYFTISGHSRIPPRSTSVIILCLISILTIAANAFALSAIGFRIWEWGITPNRMAVLGANIIILINLVLVAIQLIRVLVFGVKMETVGRTIGRYLPVYILWGMVVVVLFPLIFGIR